MTDLGGKRSFLHREDFEFGNQHFKRAFQFSDFVFRPVPFKDFFRVDFAVLNQPLGSYRFLSQLS